jgi:hypothetical protein
LAPFSNQFIRQVPPLEPETSHKGLGSRQGLGRSRHMQPFLVEAEDHLVAGFDAKLATEFHRDH